MDEQRKIRPDFVDKYQAAKIRTVEGDTHSYRNAEAKENKETGELEIHRFGRVDARFKLEQILEYENVMEEQSHYSAPS